MAQRTIRGLSTAGRLGMAALVAVTSLGCARRAPDSTAVPDSTLAAVLAELHVLSAELQLEYAADSLALERFGKLEFDSPRRDSLLAVYGLTEGDFMNAMEPYISEPSRYVSLYNQVLDRLNRKRQSGGRAASPSDGP